MNNSKKIIYAVVACLVLIAAFVTVFIQIKSSTQIDENALIQPKSITMDRSLSKPTVTQMIRAARLYFSFWNTGEYKYINAVVAPTFTDHTLTSDQPQGIEGLKATSNNLRKSFPDLHCTLEDLLITGDMVTARLEFTGTSENDFLGHPRTSKPVKFVAIDILRIKDGRVTESWLTADYLSLIQQLNEGLAKKIIA